MDLDKIWNSSKELTVKKKVHKYVNAKSFLAFSILKMTGYLLIGQDRSRCASLESLDSELGNF